MLVSNEKEQMMRNQMGRAHDRPLKRNGAARYRAVPVRLLRDPSTQSIGRSENAGVVVVVVTAEVQGRQYTLT
jgi:hypothetical protein